MKKIIIAISIFAVLFIVGCASSTAATKDSYAVLLGLNPEEAAILTDYDTVVIDAQYFTKDEIAAVQAHGTTVLSYLNIGSIETFREGYDALKDVILAPYDNWPEEYWVDVSKTEWQSFIAEEAQALIDKGADGFFLDNADVYYLYPTPAIYDGLTAILLNHEQYEKPILINGGDVFVTKAVLDAEVPLSAITGVNQECVFTNIDFGTGALIRQDAENTRYYQDYLARCKAAGLDVYLLEYAPKSSSIEKEIRSYCETNEYQFYLSHTINLDGK